MFSECFYSCWFARTGLRVYACACGIQAHNPEFTGVRLGLADSVCEPKLSVAGRGFTFGLGCRF